MLAFQVRAAAAREGLETAEWSRPMSGKVIDLTAVKAPPRGLIQYRIDFISADGGLSPSLSEVTIRFK